MVDNVNLAWREDFRILQLTDQHLVRRGGYLRPGFVPGGCMIVLHRDGFETYVRLKDGTVLYKDSGG